MLTKVAIAIGFIVYCIQGLWSPVVAIVLACICIALSFAVDNARQRSNRPNLVFPPYWVMVLGISAIVVPLIMIGNNTVQMMTAGQALAASYLGATILSLIFLSSEGIANKMYDFFVRLFAGGKQMIQNKPTTRFPEPQYTDFVPPPNWRYQCPQCFARVDGPVVVCWNCNYGADGDSTLYNEWAAKNGQPLLASRNRPTDTPPPESKKRIPVQPRD